MIFELKKIKENNILYLIKMQINNVKAYQTKKLDIGLIDEDTGTLTLGTPDIKIVFDTKYIKMNGPIINKINTIILTEETHLTAEQLSSAFIISNYDGLLYLPSTSDILETFNENESTGNSLTFTIRNIHESTLTIVPDEGTTIIGHTKITEGSSRTFLMLCDETTITIYNLNDIKKTVVKGLLNEPFLTNNRYFSFDQIGTSIQDYSLVNTHWIPVNCLLKSIKVSYVNNEPLLTAGVIYFDLGYTSDDPSEDKFISLGEDPIITWSLLDTQEYPSKVEVVNVDIAKDTNLAIRTRTDIQNKNGSLYVQLEFEHY